MTPTKKTPTIYDVAKLAGVSIATISRVLNSPDKVSPETHKKVMSAIDRLGFVPKAEARAWAMQGTGRIGVLTPFFTAPSFVQRLRGAAAALSKANYELVIYPVDAPERLQGHLSSIPLMKNVDGLIIMSLAIEDIDAKRLSANGMETVLIEYNHRGMNSILIDDEYGGGLAAEHFIKKGHKTFAFIGDVEPPERFSIHPVRSRLKGYKQKLQEAGFSISKAHIVSAPYTQTESRKAALELLQSPKPPTAIFAASDFQALAVMKAARQLGIKIPDDVALVGFDDIDVAEHVDLTTISQHLDESGRLAVEILLSRIHEHGRPLQHVNLPLTLIERASA